MPRYDYECSACGDVFEASHSFHDPPLTECKLCHGGPVQRLVSGGLCVFVKGRPIETGQQHKIRPIGWANGPVDAEARMQRHAAETQELRKLAHEQKRSCSKKPGFKLIASYPTELAAARMSEFGKDYLSNDIEDKAKRDGVWLGD